MITAAEGKARSARGRAIAPRPTCRMSFARPYKEAEA